MKKQTTPKGMEYPQGELHRYAVANGMTPHHDGYRNCSDMVILPATTAEGQDVTIYARRDVFTGTLSAVSVEY